MNRKFLVPAMLVAIVLFAASSLLAAEKAIIAVAAEGQTPAALVSTLAARSPYFLLFTENGELVEVVANPHQQAAGGAGPQVVELLAAKGVKTVIAGEFGAKMAGAMKAKGIASRIAAGSAAEAAKTGGR